MDSNKKRTPERLLIIGCTAFAGIDSVAWDDQVVPNIADYDTIIVSVPHIRKEFLACASGEFFKSMRKALLKFLCSKGKMIVLASSHLGVARPKKYPDSLSNIDWCPISYQTLAESGKSIIEKQISYPAYLKKMTEWTYCFSIPNNCLSNELIDYYGPLHSTQYKTPQLAYLENRYGRMLAGQFHLEVRRAHTRSNTWGDTSQEYPDSPDVKTGDIVLLPLLGKTSPEEALADILKEEIGYTAKSPEPDWSQAVEMPFVSEWARQITQAETEIIARREQISSLNDQINDICSYRRLLYASGPELEEVVKKCFQYLGVTVTPAKYSQEEYILNIDEHEFLIEVKGVSKSITLTHLRQLNDYLLKYQEETGKECKGILFGNAWRNLPLEQRATDQTPEFPADVVKRAEQWGISLVSSRTFFQVFLKALHDKSFSKQILKIVSSSEGVAQL